MVRPRKKRKVGCMPRHQMFYPSTLNDQSGVITMSLEEYETIRLIDYNQQTQVECSETMGVARTTVQQIYADARLKLAKALIDGKALQIAGGDYELTHRHCHRHCRFENIEKEKKMIAIPVDENKQETTVCFSYGRCPYFMLVNEETKEISFVDNSANAAVGGAGIKAAQTLVDLNVSKIITQRCGSNAADVLKAAGITILRSKYPTAQENIAKIAELTDLSEIHEGLHQH